MKQRARAIVICGVLAGLLAAAGPVLAQPAAETEVANVAVKFRLGRIENGKRSVVKTYDLVVASGAVGSTLLSGHRVPFPMANGEGDGTMPRIVYQNIGFVTKVEAWIVGDKTIRIQADLEDSRIREADSGPPTVETRQLTVNAVLRDGEPLELTRVESEIDPSGFVEVEARILGR